MSLVDPAVRRLFNSPFWPRRIPILGMGLAGEVVSEAHRYVEKRVKKGDVVVTMVLNSEAQ